MKINNVEFDFDATDTAQVKRMQNALKKMEFREKEIKAMGGEDPIEVLEALIAMISEFFIETIGIDVLKGVTSYQKAQNYYFLFLSEIIEQKQKLLAPYSSQRLR